ncbi:hypothetical protein KG112_08480 [Nocardioides sp. zg-ZUI104]|uniref:hypothetical protein n=1 Tax=Nocardioides faecalis TaxID=2803858 RepID=UPI001BCB92A0|nr:hypothetical protein [Nocardioides faecalis]MBS4752840.1 hypothetical protein [Nocardioides faecalis]
MRDIIDRLDAELGAPPPATFDVAATVAAGRRSVRRRRLAAGSAVLGVVLLAGGVAWGAGLPGVDRAEAPLAGQGATYVPVTDLGDQVPVAYTDGDDGGGDGDGDGAIALQEGWRVTERVDDPLGDAGLRGTRDAAAAPVAESVGLAVHRGDQERWVLLFREPDTEDADGSASGSGGAEVELEPGATFPDLATWLEVRVGLLTTGTSTELVTVDERDRVRGRHGVQVRDQEVLAAGGPTSATRFAARLALGAEELWVVVQRTGTGAETALADVTAADDWAPAEGATVADFAAWLTGPEGEGTR